MKLLDYNQAHKVVDSHKGLFWDGWDIVAWVRNPNAATDPRGAYRNGQWGICHRYTVNEDGLWKVPNKYVNKR